MWGRSVDRRQCEGKGEVAGGVNSLVVVNELKGWWWYGSGNWWWRCWRRMVVWTVAISDEREARLMIWNEKTKRRRRLRVGCAFTKLPPTLMLKCQNWPWCCICVQQYVFGYLHLPHILQTCSWTKQLTAYNI